MCEWVSYHPMPTLHSRANVLALRMGVVDMRLSSKPSPAKNLPSLDTRLTVAAAQKG